MQQARKWTLAGLAVAAVVWTGCRDRADTGPYRPRAAGTVTYHKDIAPIIHRRCAPCHRPGEAGPFPLLEYADLKKRTGQVAEVTARRLMPPWLPEAGRGRFSGERRLTDTELGLLQQWIAEGATEGKASDAPAPPRFVEGWQLGVPDLVVTLPQPYVLPAEGSDVYRHFVVPIAGDRARYVRAVEFQPRTRVVHHAFLFIDRTRGSRMLDARDAEPGFGGMNKPPSAEVPEGQFLSWQPGRPASAVDEGLSWQLHPGADLVLQLHLQPAGKPEPVQPSVGFFFTDQPPRRQPRKLYLGSYKLVIPPGEAAYAVTDSYTLPADVDLLRILPHAHFLARRMESHAVLPDGRTEWLLSIPQWDFSWQGDYRYERPVRLPKGSTLHMRFVYDNSTNNVRNPSRPPRTVEYGAQSTDEMAELWFQVMPCTPADDAALTTDFSRRVYEDVVAFNEFLLRRNPNDALAHQHLGEALRAVGRRQEAWNHFQAAVRLDPSLEEPHYHLGVILRETGRLPEARRELLRAVELNPEHFRAHGNLGLLGIEFREFDLAEKHFRAALQIRSDDAVAHDGLGMVLFQRGRIDEAEAHFRTALRLDPTDKQVQQRLDYLLKRKRG